MGQHEKIITQQRVAPGKLARAKQLRHTMTPAEHALWQHLRGNRLAGLHFRRQQVIDGLIVDFYCHQAGVVVEVDGPVHEGQVDYDDSRTRWLEGRGLRVIRYTNAEVEANLDAVLAHIQTTCVERISAKPPSSAHDSPFSPL